MIKQTVQMRIDAAVPVVKDIGNALGRTVKALLAPIRAFLWSWETIEQIIFEFAYEFCG